MLNIPTSKKRRSLSELYSHFFFKKETPYGLALVRIFLPLVLFTDMIPRWSRARELFSLDGATAPLWVSYSLPDWLPLFSGTTVVAMMTVMMFLMITLSIGWCSRISAFGVLVLFTYISMADSISTMSKYSVISSHVLLLLSLSHCGDVWSVDAWQKKRKFLDENPGSNVTFLKPQSFVWTRRLIQILVGIIYFGAALTKMHTGAFFTGDQMFHWSLTQLNHNHPLGEYVALQMPMVFVFAAYITIIWEVLFLFLAWGRGWGRFIMISVGVTFHGLTCLMLGLYFFPTLFCVLYLSFIEEEDVRNLSLRFRYWKTNSQWATALGATLSKWKPAINIPRINFVPQTVIFTALLCVVALTGIEAEHQIDPFGERRPEGPYQLVEMDPAEVHRLLTPSEAIRRKDTVLDMSVGTVVIAQFLANPHTDFEQGDCIVVQTSFNPPHPDMLVECSLFDSENRIVRRNPQVILRETLRMHYYFNLDESLEPGEYTFKLESNGEQLLTKKINLKGKNTHSPVAN